MNAGSLMRTKSIEQSLRDTQDPEHQLKKELGWLDLMVFGIGVIIGAGIFILTGQAAAKYAGPSVALSFVAAAVACGLAALCYAEFASTVPVAGSAYTFSYATFGELIAWIVGWDLILEFTVGSAALASGFSSYFNNLLKGTPLELPHQLSSAATGWVDLPAIILVIAIAAVLILGIKLSSLINQVVVAIKLIVVVIVIGAGIGYINTKFYSPFIPPSKPPGGTAGASFYNTSLFQTIFSIKPGVFGFGGIMSAASVVFFAFIGFDVVATTAEETKNPQRNLPIGILGSLVVTTVLYVAVCFIITGVQKYTKINPEDGAPLATAFDAVGAGWIGHIISVGATIGLTVVCMILMLGQSRVGFAMARDGLFPRPLAKVHPKWGTPYRVTLITAGAVALIGGFIDLSTLANLVNIGTLFAFILVSIGVWILRRKRPDLPRAFRLRAVPVISTLAALSCFYLMLNLTGTTWLRFGIWMAIGFVVYFAYGHRHSRLATEGDTDPGSTSTATRVDSLDA
jgi:APA family basic amino acid/polyamine antiporter